MKKTCSFIALIIVLAIALTSCAAWGTPDSAQALWDKIDKRMSKYKSFETTTETEMVAYIQGNKITGSSQGRTIAIGESDDKNFYYYETSTNNVECAELDVKEETTSTTAFSDGKMFLSNKSEERDQKLYSPMSAEQFAEHRERLNSDLENEIFMQCEKSEFKQNDDKSWTLSFSGYTDEAIAKISENMSLDNSTLGGDVVDMSVVISADKKYNITEMNISFSFNPLDIDNVPSVSAKITYSKLNEAEPIAMSIEGYTKVDDVSILPEVSSMLGDIERKSNGAFDANFDQKVLIGGTQSVPLYSQKDVVKYGKTDGKFFYEVVMTDAQGSEYKEAYADGKKSVSWGEYTEKTDMSEQDAHLFIGSLIKGCEYEEALVQNVTKKSDSYYIFDCAVKDVSAYDALLEGIGATYKSSTNQISVTVKNGEITHMTSNVEIIANTTGGVRTEMKIVLTCKIEFK